ncbi:MAG TPA: ribonuclease E/G, partial [Acidimicrobiia bacterium]|nr:ribonuclease E/G [Acidimicrobiia bacterium]
MALFRRRTPEVLKKTTSGELVEERKKFRIGGQTVEVRRVEEAPTKATSRTERPRPEKKGNGKKRSGRSDAPARGTSRGRTNGRPPVEEEIIVPTDVGRRQMLVRSAGGQTQIVVLEGPVLVEHYVARPDKESLVGNIYLAKTRNVLPGMEASFLDFGVAKNGVLYASDVAYDRKQHRNGPPRIEESLAEGDEVLVQVVKDPMGAKGARLTGTPSLPGRYLVLVPDSDTHGISRRLPEEERIRLRQVIDAVKPEEFGVIVRTAALHATAEEIASDISRLVESWEEITARAESGGAPRAIYEEPDLLIRVIRENFTADFRRLLIEDKAAYESVMTYLRATAPDLVAKVQLYEDEMGLFERYHVEDQLRKALDRRVFLPSGGHLVLDRTEALTVIDVNTGKFVGTS